MTETVQLIDPPRRDPEKERRRRRRSFWRKSFLGLIILLLCCGIALFAISGYSPTKAFRLLNYGLEFAKDRTLHTPPFGGKQQVNILLLGTDVSFGGSSRTDTIKLVTVDFARERISMLSIPRDTWVTLPNGREGRINSAHQLGGNNRNRCVALAETAVTDLLSDLCGETVHVDRYVRIQPDRFAKLVDALGGVSLDVEKQMDYEDPSQGLLIHLKPGLQHLNGEEAMGYVRFRHDAEGDYGRIKRQDKFLRTLSSQIKLSGNKTQMIKLVSPMLDLMSSDISVNDALAVKELAGKVGMDGIQSVELPTVATRKGKAEVVEVKDRVAAGLAVKELLHGPRPTVLVLNGTRRTGVARTASENIGSDMYHIVGMGTTKEPVAQSMVFTTAKYQNEATSLATLLGLPAVIEMKNLPPAFDLAEPDTPMSPPQITVVLGGDYQYVQASGMQGTTSRN